MTIPKKLKIGGHDITVIVQHIDDDDHCHGLWDPTSNTILIEETDAQSQQEASLLHEILHVLNATIDEDHIGHAFLDALSEQLYQVLKDNKIRFS